MVTLTFHQFYIALPLPLIRRQSPISRRALRGQSLFHPVDQSAAEQELHLSRRHVVTHLKTDLASDIYDHKLATFCQYVLKIC